MIDASKWYAKLQAENECLMELWGLKCNRALFSDHIERMKTYKPAASGWVIKDEEEWGKNMREVRAKNGFEHAYAAYNRHVIVLCSSFILRILFEYVEDVLEKRPNKMLLHLPNGDNKSKVTVSLSEILKSNTKEDLLKKLIRRSAASITTGKFRKILSSVEKIGDIKLPSEISAILELRNNIVHDEEVVEVSLAVAQQAIYTVSNLVSLIQDANKNDRA